jgi:hypothetical protein
MFMATRSAAHAEQEKAIFDAFIAAMPGSRPAMTVQREDA